MFHNQRTFTNATFLEQLLSACSISVDTAHKKY